MTITKRDIKKLRIFYSYLNLYLADWTNHDSFFYHADSYQRDLAGMFIDGNGEDLPLKQANDDYKELDADDKDHIKDMLRSKELSFKASPAKPLHYYKFNYIKIC